MERTMSEVVIAGVVLLTAVAIVSTFLGTWAARHPEQGFTWVHAVLVLCACAVAILVGWALSVYFL